RVAIYVADNIRSKVCSFDDGDTVCLPQATDIFGKQRQLFSDVCWTKIPLKAKHSVYGNAIRYLAFFFLDREGLSTLCDCANIAIHESAPSSSRQTSFRLKQPARRIEF